MRGPAGGLENLEGPERLDVDKVRGPSGKLYTSTSFFVLRPGYEPRRSAILLIESSFFDPFILLTILANCATMAWQSPLDPCCTWKASFIDKCEWIFLAIFTMEMLTKICAYGFICHKESYLHDAWCQLDFTVVTLAWLPILFPSMGNYSVLRAFRALRPLRALKRVPGMPVLVQWILSVLPKMGNVLMLCGFIFLVFGIVGMELFKGSLHNRCALPGFKDRGFAVESKLRNLFSAIDVDLGGSIDEAELHEALLAAGKNVTPEIVSAMFHDADYDYGGSIGFSEFSNILDFVEDDSFFSYADDPVGPHSSEDAFDTSLSCLNGTSFGVCPQGTTCAYFDTNPGHGMTSFDSVALAFISFIQAVTFDDWATPMYALMASFSPYVWLYFVLVVVIAGFFVVNLFLAVIFLEFGDAKDQIKADQAASRSASQSASRSASRSASQPASRAASRPHSRSNSRAPSPQFGGSGESTPGGASTPREKLLDGVSMLSDGRKIVSKPEHSFSCQNAFTAVAKSDTLSNLSTGLVLINVVLMCMPYDGMTAEYADHLEQGATIISWLFIIEMFIKLLGLGCKGYWSDGWNCLDGTIVCLSIFEMLMTALASGTGVKLTFLRMLRMLRVLRILRLMRSWRGLYKILSTFLRAIPQMMNLVFLIVLTMFMFALLGMQLFGGIFDAEHGYSMQEPPQFCKDELCPDGTREKPIHHFDYCYTAMLTVFVLLTGEWIDAMEPVAEILGPIVCVFFIFVVMIGKYLLMNLLIAVILNEFQEDKGRGGSGSSINSSQLSSPASTSTPNSMNSSPVATRLASPIPSRPGSPVEGSTVRDTGAGLASLALKEPPQDGNCIRRGCRWAIRQPWFDRFVIVAILASSICLALDTPRLDRESELADRLAVLDKVFTVIFFCEMCTKITALGFAGPDKDTYIKSPWNQVDFALVCISILIMFADSVQQLRPLRVLRVLRVLRPLRLISRSPGMKLIINSLFRAMPAVINVFGVVLAMQVVFVILGMQLFSGTFGSCSDPSFLTRDACIGDLGKLLDTGDMTGSRYWANPAFGSFDNFGDAMRLLYIMSSADQWEQPMYLMMGANEAGTAPTRNDSSPMAMFALAWMFCGYIFAINIFVGVVVDNFSRMQREQVGGATMTPEQKQWADTMKTMASRQPIAIVRPPEGSCRMYLYRFINTSHFDGFITGVIIANIAIMACDYYGIEHNPQMLYAYERAMDCFAFIYYIEAIIKLIALGCNGYFADSWSRFDFFLVCTSLIDQFATELLSAILPLPPMLLRVLRVFRILRILRLLKGAKQLRDLIVTMILSFPALLNVSSLLALIIFIYSILGVNLFTFVAHGDPILDAHGGINFQRNFDTMGHAVLVLLQCLTSDGWSTIMADAMIEEGTGKCAATDGNCGSPAAIPYFISFQIIGSFIFLNLVIAVILENFTLLYFVSPNLASAADIDLYIEAWQEFDPDATNYVPLQKLPELLLKVPRPLGVKGLPRNQALRLCLRLRVPLYNGEVEFREVLAELVENNFFRSGVLEADPEGFKDIPIPEVQGSFKVKAASGEANDEAGLDGEEETETVAQIFAMAKMHTAQDLFMEWLERVRLRLALRKATMAALGPRKVLQSDHRQTFVEAPSSNLPKVLQSDEDPAAGVGLKTKPPPVAMTAPPAPETPPTSAPAAVSESAAEMTALELVGLGTADTSSTSPRRSSCGGPRFSSPQRRPSVAAAAKIATPLSSTSTSRALVHPATTPTGRSPQMGDLQDLTALELVGIGGNDATSRSPRKSPRSSARNTACSSQMAQASNTQGGVDNAGAEADHDALVSHMHTEPLTAAELVGTGGTPLSRTLSSPRKLRSRSPRKVDRTHSLPRQVRARSPLKEGRMITSPRLFTRTSSMSPQNRRTNVNGVVMIGDQQNQRGEQSPRACTSHGVNSVHEVSEEPLSALELVGIGGR